MKTKTKRTKRTGKALLEVLAERPPRIDAALLDALRRSPESMYEICKQTGLDKGQLSRFRAGQRDLKLGTAAVLAEYFGLRLVNGKG